MTSLRIGRTCRFLQGPNTDPATVKRVSQALADGREHYQLSMRWLSVHQLGNGK